MPGRFFKSFIAVWYLMMATNVAGVAQGCTCHDKAHDHDRAAMVAMMDHDGVDCTGDRSDADHIGIQNWDYYLPAPEIILAAFQGNQIYAPRLAVNPSSYGHSPDKIPI